MSKPQLRFAPTVTPLDDINQRIAAIEQQRDKEYKKRVATAIANSEKIGKEPFDLTELKKYWAYRFEKTASTEECAQDMKQLEEDYHLAGDKFMTMRAYGEYLMMLELYR